MADNPAPGQGETFDPKPQTKTQEQKDTVTLSTEQFEALLSRLEQGNTVNMSPSPAITSGLQTNALGQVVGTITKFSIDPENYQSPVDDLLDDFEKDSRMRRFNLRDNYYISWDMSSKPYQTKDNLSVQEPTFQVTIHEYEFDDEGNETGRFIIRKTLQFNEDEELTNMYASEQGVSLTGENMKDIYNRVRYQRVRNFITDYFFPPRSFQQNTDSQELAIDGQVFKVVTKSNVKGWDKTPVISEEELS